LRVVVLAWSPLPEAFAGRTFSETVRELLLELDRGVQFVFSPEWLMG